MLRQIILAGLLWVSFSGTAVGQSWRDVYAHAQEAYEKGNYEQAQQEGEQSLKDYLAQSAETGDSYASILRLLSNISYAQSKYTSGLEYVTKELQIRSAKKDTTYAIALVNQALFLEELTNYDRAVTSLKEALDIFNTFYPEDDLHVLECRVKIGVNEYLHNDFKSASGWFDAPLKISQDKKLFSETMLEGFYYAGLMEKELGQTAAAITRLSEARAGYEGSALTNTVNYALVLYELARVYAGSGSFEKAEESYSAAQLSYEAVAGKEGEAYYNILAGRGVNYLQLGKRKEALSLMNELKTLPGADLAYASLLNSMAAVYQASSQYKDAEALYIEAMGRYKGKDKEAMLGFAETNQNLAMLYSENGDQLTALTSMATTREILENLFGKYHYKYVRSVIRTGDIQLKAGKVDEARSSYEEALQLMDKMLVKPEAERFSALGGMATVEMMHGNFRRADSLFTSLLQPYEAGAKTKDIAYATTLNNLAASRQAQGQWAEARNMVARSVSTTGQLTGRQDMRYALALENLAMMNIRLGDLTAAKPQLDSVLAITEAKEGKESVAYANVLMDMGRYYQVTGDYTKAEPFLKSAREVIKTKLGEKNNAYALSLNALAILYQTLGNYGDAEPLLRQSISIITEVQGKSNANYSTALQNLATLYQLEGKLSEAEPLLREALDIDKQILGEDNPQYAIALQNLATLYQKLGRQDDAMAILEKVLASTEKHLGKEHPSYATTLSNLAALYQDKGDFVRAETTWKSSVELRRRILGEDHPDYARSLYGLAGVYHGMGELEKARTYYEPVVAKYQKQVVEFFPTLSEKEKSAFYAKIKPVFDSFQDFCVQYQSSNPVERSWSVQRLYDLQLSTKAILLNATNKVRSRIQSSGDVTLQQTFKEWLTLKESIVRYYALTQSERERMKIDLAAQEARANDLEKQLSERSDAFKSQFEKEIITWQSVRAALKENEAAVEILRIKKKYTKDSVYYAALILRKSDEMPSLVIWPQGTQLETKRFRYHRNTIKFHFRDTLSYHYYWQPLAASLAGINTVYLSCDGVFNKVNFNSIFNPSTGRFIIDDFTLRQVSNTREIAEHTAFKPSANSALLLGFADFNLEAANTVGLTAKRGAGRAFAFDGEEIPVLPATEKEVDKVEQLLRSEQWQVSNFKRSSATEEVIKQSENPRLIHIATHGFFLSDVDIREDENSELLANPLFRSGVLLAGAGVERSALDNVEDGVLTAYEAMNLNLDKTETVVLSACETGLGEVRNGEGVYGLQRSFLVAGANSVLMSLWQVDDVATQELMDAYYANWLKGSDKHQAFRQAQLDMKEKYKEPYYWGAFVLIGY